MICSCVVCTPAPPHLLLLQLSRHSAVILGRQAGFYSFSLNPPSRSAHEQNSPRTLCSTSDTLGFFYVDLEGCTRHSLGWPQTWSNPPPLQRKRRAYMCMSSHPPSRPKLPAPSKGSQVSWPSVQGGEAGHCNSLSLAVRSTQHTWRDAAPPHSPGACGPGALLLWSPPGV